MVPALIGGAAGGSLFAKGDGFGSSFCFFFCTSGSTDGEAEAVSSIFRFFCTCLSVFPKVGTGGIDVVFSEANAEEKGVKRFLKAEPISPSRRAASSASCAASEAASLGVSSRLSFFDSVRFNTFGLAEASGFGVGFGASTMLGGGFCDFPALSTSMNGAPLSLATAFAFQ